MIIKKITVIKYITEYPEVILIKRSDRINLIDDEYLAIIDTNISTGKERREIKDIDNIEIYLQNKYFNNAKLIICAHGAVMSNMFFCKKKTIIIEVTCGTSWKFFDKITEILNLNHIKCHKNYYENIINCIEINKI